MTWDAVSAAWSAVWSEAEAGWKSLYDSAVKTWEQAIRQDPTAYEPQVEAWVADLATARQNLDHIQSRLPHPPATPADEAAVARYRDLERRYHELAAAFYADARPVETTTPAVGFVPVLIAAGLAVGVGGTAWAVAAYEYAANLRDETALAASELDARVKASEAGRTLQPSTLPAPTEAGFPMPDASKVAPLVLGGLVLAASAFALPLLLKRS